MKIRYLYYIAVSFFLPLLILSVSSCTQLETSKTKDPQDPTGTPRPKPSPSPSPEPNTPGPAPSERLESFFAIEKIAISDECAKESFGSRGVPPRSYMRGIALSYARAVCNPDNIGVQTVSRSLGSADRDALAHYALENQTAAYRLASTYALMIGSGARESSWRWCVGRDSTADNVDGNTAEAGLYQTSWNSRSAHPDLAKLFEHFKKDQSGCFASQYQGETKCSDANMKNWGDGNGMEFQRLSKACPGFATEYHAIMLRVLRQHYGPINRREAIFKKSCVAMFQKIRAAIADDLGICNAF